MASDDDNELSAATRDEIAARIATLQSDYTTATACAYAIIETEAKNLKPGDEYDQSFDLFGCPQYAVAARAGVDDERNCVREKAEFDLVITTDDLDRLKEFEARSQCSVYKSQAYTRILGLEDGTASTGGVAGLDINGPTGLYSGIPLPPKRDPAPPTIEVRN